MQRFHFSIASFFVAFTLLAFGLGAYGSQSEWLGNCAYMLFVGLVCLATAGAIITRSGQQRFWIGFAIFGWAYWFVGFDSTLSSQHQSNQAYWGYSNSATSSSQPRLFTSDLLDFGESMLVARKQVGDKVIAQWRGGGYYPGTIREIVDRQYLVAWDDGSAPQLTPASGIQGYYAHSRVAGHAVLGSLAALCGGLLAAWLFEQQEEQPK